MIHLVRMHRGVLRALCGVQRDEGVRPMQDDVVTCPFCRGLVNATLRGGAPQVTLTLIGPEEVTWRPPIGVC